MITGDIPSEAPSWGDTPEFRAWCQARHDKDPKYTTLPDLIRPEIEAARDESPQEFVDYLNKLSGVADFSIKGPVYRPKLTKAFGDWVILPRAHIPDIESVVVVDTQDSFPYVKEKLAYMIRGAYVQQDSKVMIIMEEAVEDGRPVIVYPDELERFDLYYIHDTDALEERDRKYTRGIL